MKTHALILCGGLGTRLRSVVVDRPKVLADVNGRPFLCYLLDRLAHCGIKAITLLTGYKAEFIERTVGFHYHGMNIGYSHESSPLGTGGAIRKAAKVIACDNLLVLNGDTYFGIDIHKFVDSSQSDFDLMACRRIKDVGRYGKITIGNCNLVAGFHEKSNSGEGLINGGIYLLNRLSLCLWDKDVFSLERDYLPFRVTCGKLLGIEEGGPFIDIGIPSDLARAGDLLP